MKDLFNRLVIIIIILPVVLYLLYADYLKNVNILILVLVIGIIVFWELYKLGIKKNIKIKKEITLSFIILSSILVYFLNYLFYITEIEIFFIIIGISYLSVLFYLFDREIKDIFSNYLYNTFIFVYIALPISLIITFYFRVSFPFYKLLYFLIVVWSTDSFAYLIGTAIKNRHVVKILKVSPNKSYEGFSSGLILGVICPVFLWKLYFNKYFDFNIYEIVIITFIISVLTMLGDLFESMIKRYFEVKDSSNLFKGHGGFLDMIDSILFAFPFYYFLLVLFNQ